MADKLADVKMLIQVSSSDYCERLFDTIPRHSKFARYISRLKARVETETEKAVEVLDSGGAEVFAEPAQSLYLWASLDGYPDSTELVKEMLAKNISLAPGAIFYLENLQASSWCRYNVGYAHDPRFLQRSRVAASRRWQFLGLLAQRTRGAATMRR